MALTKSKRYEGVFYNELKNGDRTFYILYRNIISNKKIDLKIGKKSEGITEQYCFQKRAEILNQLRLGEAPKSIKSRRMAINIVTFDMIAEQYYESKKLYMKEANWKDAVSIYTNHIKAHLGNKNIEEITSFDIRHLAKLK